MGSQPTSLCTSGQEVAADDTAKERYSCFSSACHCGDQEEMEVVIKTPVDDPSLHALEIMESVLPCTSAPNGAGIATIAVIGPTKNLDSPETPRGADEGPSKEGDDEEVDTEIPEGEADGEGCESKGHLYRSRATLRAVLDAGDAVLVRGSWLVKLAGERGVLPRRQELPAEAACSAESVLSAPIVVVSHCWQSPEHPDPQGEQLQRLGQGLKRHMATLDSDVGDIAVFFDWCSLYQVPRSPAEEAAFERGVGGMGLWFGHRETAVWMLTKVSWGARNYADRGWPYFEKTVSQMITAIGDVLDLGRMDESCQDWQKTVAHCSARRRPPPTAPDVFARELRCKVFRVGADHDLVVKLYRQTFEDLFGSAKELSFGSLNWGDADADALAATILDCRELRELDLSENDFGDDGARQIANSIPMLSRLRRLKLGGNEIGDSGAVRLAEMLPRCRRLQDLTLGGNTIGDSGVARLAEVLPRCSRLLELRLARNEIGDRGAGQLAAALPQCTSLRRLDLSENEIGDRGAAMFAAAMPRCGRLRKLDLARNRVGDQGAEKLAEALPFCRRLQEFGVGGNEIGEILGGGRIHDAGAAALAPAFRRCTDLRKVDLSDNQIGDRGAEKIAAVIPHLEGLAELDLCGNCIGDGGASKIAEAIRSCSKLRKLRFPAKCLRDGSKRQLREAWRAGGRSDSELSIL